MFIALFTHIQCKKITGHLNFWTDCAGFCRETGRYMCINHISVVFLIELHCSEAWNYQINCFVCQTGGKTLVNVIVLCIVPFIVSYQQLDCTGWTSLCHAWETAHSTAWYSPESVWTNDNTVWLADVELKKYMSRVEWEASQLTLFPPPPHTRRLYHGLGC